RRWSARRTTPPSTSRSARSACRWSGRSRRGSSLPLPGPEQRRLDERQPEDVAAETVERDLRGEELHPVARAPELVAPRDGPALPREPWVDRADRLLRRAPVRPRDPGCRD